MREKEKVYLVELTNGKFLTSEKGSVEVDNFKEVELCDAEVFPEEIVNRLLKNMKMEENLMRIFAVKTLYEFGKHVNEISISDALKKV